jgi:hypothetical protein
MKKELSYLASKRWEKFGNQELPSTPYQQEIDPWWNGYEVEDMMNRAKG